MSAPGLVIVPIVFMSIPTGVQSPHFVSSGIMLFYHTLGGLKLPADHKDTCICATPDGCAKCCKRN